MFLPAAHLLFLVAIWGTAMVTDSLAMGGILTAVYAIGLGAVSKGWAIPQIIETLLALVLLPLAWMYARMKGDADLISFQYWMTLLLVVRAWKILQRRDYLFSLCMAAGIYAQIGKVYSDFPFSFLTVLNVLLAPHALHEVFVRFHPAQMSWLQGGKRVVRARSLAAVSLWLAVTMTLVFLVLPRRGQDMAMMKQDITARLTGFSDNIALGSFAKIKQNHQIAMTVITDHPGMWRGSVMDLYRGGTWRSSSAEYRWRKPNEQGALISGVPTYRHRIHILNLNLLNLRFFSKGNVADITRIRAPENIRINDLNGTLGVAQSDVRNMREVEYELTTQDGEYFGLPILTERMLEAPGLGRIAENKLYLQVAEDVTPEVRGLAATLTRGVTDQAEKVQAVESYLRENCTYALTDLDSGNRPPLDYFLFDQKRGHCEYFATAMAVLLRCADVPTRVVQGFAPGILVDGAYAVRMSDAHLWVDVFYPGKGWKSHDPTPVMESALAGDMAAGTWFERMQIKWLSYVMNYDGGTQLRLWSRLTSLAHWPVTTLQTLQADGGVIGWIMVLVCIGGVFWAMIRQIQRIRWSKRNPVEKMRDGGIPVYFKRYLQALDRNGYKREANATALELLERLTRDRVSVLNEARFLTDLYLRSRYRADQPSPDDLSRAQDALAAVRRWKR